MAGQGIYFLERKVGMSSTLKFFDFETRGTTPLTTLERQFVMIGLTVAPDERSISTPGARTTTSISCWSKTSANGPIIRSAARLFSGYAPGSELAFRISWA